MSALELHIKSAVGFAGKVPGGLKYTRDGDFVVYPLGSFIVLKNLQVRFLTAFHRFIALLTNPNPNPNYK